MDANKANEARNRRREEVLARRVGEALDQLAPAAKCERSSEGCPDAERIAAYHERVLGREETAQCEAHFAGCSRCRKILAVLAVSTDAPLAENEVAQLGALGAASRVPQAPPAQAPQSVRSRRPFHPDWRIRWLAPALGLAAALAAWFAIRPPWHVLEPHSSGSLVAQVPQNEGLPPATAPALPAERRAFSAAPTEKHADSRTSSTTPETKPAPNAKASQPGETSADAVASREAVNPALGANSPPALSNLKSEKNEPRNVNRAAAALPQPAPAPQALVRAQEAQLRADGQVATAAPASEPPGSTSQSVTVTGEAPLVATSGSAAQAAQQAPVSNLPLNGRNFQAAARLQSAATVTIQIAAPSGKVLWRLGKNGRIERSLNGGTAWAVQVSPANEDWLAGAAVSESACWIAGRNGAIARTTDGEHWQKIAPPSDAASAAGKFPDWSGIIATDAQTATIMAGDRRRFVTQDGGKTWQRQ